jgi:hypothetical protein
MRFASSDELALFRQRRESSGRRNFRPLDGVNFDAASVGAWRS